MNNFNLDELNKYCLQRVKDYISLDIYGAKVSAPYYINNPALVFFDFLKKAKVKNEKIKQIAQMFTARKAPYGWFKGKGTPEEIVKATIQISRKVNLPIQPGTTEGIREFMKLYGIGIDCSGFVYNVLSYAFEKWGKSRYLDKILDWSDLDNKSAYRAGTSTFAGKASFLIKLKEIQPLDILLIKEAGNHKYGHIALFLEDPKGLLVVQSTLSILPNGVRSDEFGLKGDKPSFSFKPSLGPTWEQMFKSDRLEFRRLNL